MSLGTHLLGTLTKLQIELPSYLTSTSSTLNVLSMSRMVRLSGRRCLMNRNWWMRSTITVKSVQLAQDRRRQNKRTCWSEKQCISRRVLWLNVQWLCKWSGINCGNTSSQSHHVLWSVSSCSLHFIRGWRLNILSWADEQQMDMFWLRSIYPREKTDGFQSRN